jgi:hypothetical protein
MVVLYQLVEEMAIKITSLKGEIEGEVSFGGDLEKKFITNSLDNS